MKKIHLSIILIVLISFSYAQRGGSLKWNEAGNAYYTTEKGDIVKFSLPKFDKTILVEKKALVPEGKNSELSIKSFSVSTDENVFLIFSNSKKVWRYETRGDYFIYNKNTGKLVQLGKSLSASTLMFAKISPDGKKAAYVSKHNIYVEDLGTNKITKLTKDGTDRIINGTFDWVYEEEFGCRDGFRWNPDSKSIAYWQIDARNIRNFLMINNTDSIYSFTIPVEYPKVGEDPSACKVGVVDIATQKTKWMNVPGSAIQNYITRMEWANNGKLIIQQLDRKQQVSKIYFLNSKTATASLIYTEKDNAWIDIKSRWNNDNPMGWEWVNNNKDFLWVSEKDGWRHIYLISNEGEKETLLTNGEYDMIDFCGIDEKTGFVYFTASPNNALQKYLYKVKLDGTGNAILVSSAEQNGTHSYQVSPNGLYAKHSFSSATIPPSEEWVNLQTGENIKGEIKTKPNKNATTQFFKVTTEDGVTMDGWKILPENFDSTKKYPVVFYVYTEPGSATVRDTYGSASTFLYQGNIAADGYIQISLDGRGTPLPKGAAWRKSIYKKVGILNVRDQAMAAKEILKWNYVDKSRIAVWGWSGGGSTTLNLLFQYADIYQTGIAIAPVASRLTYDNIYEERYMGLPQENKDDYIQASAITHAKGLKGNLLLVHGTGDDNVHYQNTELLINELVKFNKQFTLMSYPNRSHSISEGKGTFQHLSTLFTNYLKQHCPGGGR
ncbi:MAG TPA: DPP IV N-terminal domain-containing protein [Chitinophagaceae bacterium]|nr:S9 family peptidase [Chitinophagaceae bacterium]MCC6635972.1 DPP IV N-terminal domain-containing protein [Chitinophagaceae bacterium]HMZ45571.1 DPP IV N-terminal domain-containing protein [Chitinophagaceae bacterium]HNE92774.1 DPP IV N-terminal domain-containing protein [Chitinophagaceae bacterium]HNJ57440.1 DPP IV N-terminal domain-containing protein [Chitinophagaceae bacterium]